ncbi:MAG: DUF4347 domain-containing protein, partial [Planctomycetes bacterium]|nr:DUF4347 domain-containing protein [Planctomycetota bacterium]
MNNIKNKGWLKALFESKSRRSKNSRLLVEHLEVRLTPDAKTVPALHDLAIGISANNCATNSITLIDHVRFQQNLTDYRSSQVYFCSNDSSNFSASAFQSVYKLDAVALQAASTKGVVLIDSSLVANIPIDELKGSLVVSIDGNRDVVSQITTALEGLANVPVLRVISHGNDGVLYFGNQGFDSRVLTASATQVASWGNSLTSDADILLYGCSIADTDAGKAFVEQFASITQADIGASSNLTGKGGDEVLEFQVGQVSNALIACAIDYEGANLTLEPGDSFETAIALTAVTDGLGADGSISAAGEADYYTFTAAATGSLQVSLDAINNSGIDPYLRIYDSSTTLIATDDDNGPGLNSLAIISVVAGNIYYIKATAYGLGTGSYRVSATPIAGSSFETAIALTAPQGSTVASYDGVINPALEEDFYTYTATTTGVVNFAMAAINSSGVDSILTIYNSSFVQIARNDDSNGTLNSFISLNVTEGSVYYIKTTAYGLGTGSYRVSATPISVPMNEPVATGDSFETAITLAASSGNVASVNGEINPAFNADYYRYTATTTGVVNFAMAAIN